MTYTAHSLDGFRVTNWPVFWSGEWWALHPDDPRKRASVLADAIRWRQSIHERDRLDRLAEEDMHAWYEEITKDADAEAGRMLRRLQLSRLPTWAEVAARREKHGPVHELRATPGWPPISIPGRPGWHRHLVNGQQTDLNDTAQETAA